MVPNLSQRPREGTCRRCEDRAQLGPGGHCQGCALERALLLQAFFSKRPRLASLPPLRPVPPRLRSPANSPRRLVVLLALVVLAAGVLGWL